jgi:alpha-beta hydrolase superfamily lysophospholipase
VIARRGVVLAGLVAALLAPLGVLEAASRPVTFRTDDGVTIAGTLYEASRHPAPAVILLHMLTRSRDDWQAVASELADADIHALAIDFRGHGASSSGSVGPDGELDLSRLVIDVQAARGFLVSRPDLVRPGAIGIAGASLGANVAILEAASDPAIATVALLSPGLDYRSLRVEAAMRKYDSRPAFLVAATNDPYALRSVKQLATLGRGLRETRTPEAAGHGTMMLGNDRDLIRALVDWFQRTLL